MNCLKCGDPETHSVHLTREECEDRGGAAGSGGECGNPRDHHPFDDLTPDDLYNAAEAVKVAARAGRVTDHRLLKLAERVARAARRMREERVQVRS